jgi:hypothetical protein
LIERQLILFGLILLKHVLQCLNDAKYNNKSSGSFHIIFQDSTCVGGLVMVLSNPDVNVVRMALQVCSWSFFYPRNAHNRQNMYMMMAV